MQQPLNESPVRHYVLQHVVQMRSNEQVSEWEPQGNSDGVNATAETVVCSYFVKYVFSAFAVGAVQKCRQCDGNLCCISHVFYFKLHLKCTGDISRCSTASTRSHIILHTETEYMSVQLLQSLLIMFRRLPRCLCNRRFDFQKHPQRARALLQLSKSTLPVRL